MLKKVNELLNIFIGACFGVFMGKSVYTCLDYHAHPDLYALRSAPWYTSILVNAIFAAVVIAIAAIAKIMIRKKVKQ